MVMSWKGRGEKRVWLLLANSKLMPFLVVLGRWDRQFLCVKSESTHIPEHRFCVSGMAAAAQLNKVGHTVVVYERKNRVGGLLRQASYYGTSVFMRSVLKRYCLGKIVPYLKNWWILDMVSQR